MQTQIASLYPAVNSSGPLMMNYEIIEQLEDDRRPGAIAATNGSELVNDFSAVVSFALNITCTTDADLARRLVVDDRPMLGVGHTPRQLISRIFDKELMSLAGDEDLLNRVFEKVVSLKRAEFIGAMGAIRQYVIATHRLSDNPDLSYTLFVAAMESLAQSFDGHIGKWTDYEERKRQKIDNALENAPPEIVTRVQNAILENEHVALRNRFRSFVLKHTSRAFFREEAAGIKAPITRSAIAAALDAAYSLRSGYIHTLKPVPGNLRMPDTGFETVDIGEGPKLTYSGLARLSRHVILNFIEHCEPGDDPDFNYRSDLPGIVVLRKSSQHWIGFPEPYSVQRARSVLGAHFEEVSSLLLRLPDASVTNLNDVLAKIETLVPGLAKPSQRIPMIALYASYHLHLHEKNHRPGWLEFYKRYETDLDGPSVESFLLHLITGNEPPWEANVCDGLRIEYFEKKYSRSGLQAGQLAEAIMVLWLAEAHRKAGQDEASRSLITFAVENYPSSAALRSFEASIGPELPEISWSKIFRKD